MRSTYGAAGLILAALLAGCEKAPEKAAERMIESALEKDGTKAKVDLSKGGATITTTDASGKTAEMQLGTATVSENELGVPFYPGTKPAEGGVTKVTTPEGSMVTAVMHTDDEVAKVAAFYRERLKAQAEGKQFADMSTGEGTMLAVADEKTKTSVQVQIHKAEKGTDIQIMSARGK